MARGRPARFRIFKKNTGELLDNSPVLERVTWLLLLRADAVESLAGCCDRKVLRDGEPLGSTGILHCRQGLPGALQ